EGGATGAGGERGVKVYRRGAAASREPSIQRGQRAGGARGVNGTISAAAGVDQSLDRRDSQVEAGAGIADNANFAVVANERDEARSRRFGGGDERFMMSAVVSIAEPAPASHQAGHRRPALGEARRALGRSRVGAAEQGGENLSGEADRAPRNAELFAQPAFDADHPFGARRRRDRVHGHSIVPRAETPDAADALVQPRGIPR